MRYFRITVTLKTNQQYTGIRPSDKRTPAERQAEFEEKAFAAYGKENVRTVEIQQLPIDHPEVIKYLSSNRKN